MISVSIGLLFFFFSDWELKTTSLCHKFQPLNSKTNFLIWFSECKNNAMWVKIPKTIYFKILKDDTNKCSECVIDVQGTGKWKCPWNHSANSLSKHSRWNKLKVIEAFEPNNYLLQHQRQQFLSTFSTPFLSSALVGYISDHVCYIIKTKWNLVIFMSACVQLLRLFSFVYNRQKHVSV